MNQDSLHWELRKGGIILAALNFHASMPGINYSYFRNLTLNPAYEPYRDLFENLNAITKYSYQFDLDDDEYWEASTFYQQNIYPLGLTLFHIATEQIITPTWIEFHDNDAVFVIHKPAIKG